MGCVPDTLGQDQQKTWLRIAVSFGMFKVEGLSWHDYAAEGPPLIFLQKLDMQAP
jgi:hypothetical protein